MRSGSPGFSPPVSYPWLSRLIPNPTRAKVFALPCPFPLLCLPLPGKFLITLQGPTTAPTVIFSRHSPSTTACMDHTVPTPTGRVCLHRGALRPSGGRDPDAIIFLSPRLSRKPDLNNVDFSKCLLNVWEEIKANTLLKCKIFISQLVLSVTK